MSKRPYYRYAVATDGRLQETIFRRKSQAAKYAQTVTVRQHLGTRVYRQRHHPDTGQVDIIHLISYWWDNDHLQFWLYKGRPKMVNRTVETTNIYQFQNKAR